MLRTIALFLAFAAPTFGQTSATKEAQIWQLEKACWEYVKANDLGEVPRAVARKFCWLAICQFRASEKGSHHRLDHCEHVKRNRPSFLFDRAARDSGNRRHRDQLLSN